MSTNTKLAEALRLGREGAPATEEERLLFEAWMRGHCWALCATWNGSQYVSDAEQGGNVDPRAMNTRQIFAAWRDRAALAAHDAEQAAQAVPAGLYVGLIERLMKLSTRLGIAYEGGVEHFAASLEDRLYAICRSAEGLLDSLAAAPTPPAPEAQQAAGQAQDERAAFEAWARTYSTLPITHDAMFPHSYEDMGQAMLWDAWQARAALAQRREPLTDEQIVAAANEAFDTTIDLDDETLVNKYGHGIYISRYLDFARAIEAAHGIGATTGEQR